VRPLPPLNDKAGRCIPGGVTLPDGKVSAVELEGSILPEYGDSIKGLPFFLGT
jgi:hypothetical protein